MIEPFELAVDQDVALRMWAIEKAVEAEADAPMVTIYADDFLAWVMAKPANPSGA